MLKKLFIFLGVSLIIIANVFAQDNLVLIQNTDNGDYQRLNKQNLTHLYFNNDFCLTVVNKDNLGLLQGLSYKVLEEYQADTYYLLTVNQGEKLQVRSEWGQCFYQKDNLAILKTLDLPMENLLSNKVKFTKLQPIKQTPAVSQFRKSSLIKTHTRDLQELTNSVDPDSIAWFIQKMQDFQTRYCFAANRLAVSSWLRQQFLRMGYTDVVYDSFQAYGEWHRNVIATIPGSVTPEQVIVVGGHYDSILRTGYETSMISAPGADDNASGTTAALELARIIKQTNYQPECTIKFVGFAAEEVGLIGGYVFAQSAVQEGMQIKAMLNHDMISYCTATENYPFSINVYSGYEYLAELALDLSTQTDLVYTSSDYNSSGSDSYAFWANGFPCVYFEEHQFTPYYHTVDDLLVYSNMNFCTDIIKLTTSMVYNISAMPNKVSNFRVYDQGNGTSLIAKWNLLNEDDITQYKVRIFKTGYEMIYTTPSTDSSLVLNNLLADSLYTIVISALDSQGLEGFLVGIQATPRVVPLAPNNFDQHPLMHRIELFWNTNTEIDLAGYKLYRSTSAGVLGSLLTTLSINQISYIDETTVDGVYYYYTLKSYDTQGNESLPSEQIKSRAVSLNQGVLVVDFSNNGNGSYLHPTDEAVDDFYSLALNNFATEEFDIINEGEPFLRDLGAYSTVIIHANGFTSNSYLLNRSEVIEYLQAGGKLLISASTPSTCFRSNSGYPSNFVQNNFEYDYLKMSSANYNNQTRFLHAQNIAQDYPVLEVDSTKVPTALNNHLYGMEALTPNTQAQSIYVWSSEYADNTPQGAFNGSSVGYAYYGNDYQVVVLSVPLYYVKPNQAKSFLTYVLHNKFNEPLANDNPEIASPTISLSQNYPNPFNPDTRIEFSLDKEQQIELTVFNIKGQKVTTLYKGTKSSGHHFQVWNGKDNTGKPVASGLYFYKLETKTQTVNKKMILIK